MARMQTCPIPDLPELWVLRHGETEWNVAERLQGRLDSPLTSKGVAQAEQQGKILRAEALPRETRLICSPSGRALQTARIVARALDWAPVEDPALLEMDLGAWQGCYLADIPEARAAAQDGFDPHMWKFSGFGCESVDQMSARLRGFLTGLDGPTVIVTHGVTSRMLRCLATGRAPDALSQLPGGQGVVHHVARGVSRILQQPLG